MATGLRIGGRVEDDESSRLRHRRPVPHVQGNVRAGDGQGQMLGVTHPVVDLRAQVGERAADALQQVFGNVSAGPGLNSKLVFVEGSGRCVAASCRVGPITEVVLDTNVVQQLSPPML